MSHLKIEKLGVDIHTCPQPDITNNATQITIGDLHANSMLLMYFLVTNGVVKISDEKYAQLKDIYLKEELNTDDIKQFNAIIDSLEIGEKPLIRLIGDEICDRGQNDYFIFKILDKLNKSGVKTEILLSNHGIEFITPYEKKEPLFSLLMAQGRSMHRMNNLIQKKIITEKEVHTLVQASYLPNLKLISYTLDGNNITIYSHAGIGLETIRALAKKFQTDGVVYRDDTAEDLAKTIDAINSVFERHVRAGTVHTLPIKISGKLSVEDDPVNFLIWNREYSNLSREQEHKGYQLCYVHGHDSQDPKTNNVINLDHQLGKGENRNVGDYKILCTQGSPVVQPNPVENPFEKQLSKLESKAKILLENGHEAAYRSAMAIHSELTDAFNLLKENKNQQAFNETCTQVIARERPQLDKHRGWSEFLINLAIAIPTAGIGLLVKGVINLAQNKSFLFVHKTESSKIVDEIQNKLTPGPKK